ncbi:MerC domain-containing protein [Tenacibaculum agarivorans]|uniref:MerC domain-containing protein n=1 Tax=Tenacibaculum agarivorans TaxID=1908389 RepID=UPI00094BA79E|nr:MerC domain-containing protein [Tenacibaculum agarivorans]
MLLKRKSDVVGAFSSSLCLIHCIFTPFLFIVQSHSLACCEAEGVPSWWRSIDILFLAISFFAIKASVKTTTKNWMKYVLWFFWGLLFFVIVNEHFNWVHIPEESIYIPSLSLVALHLYNQKYCQCADNSCCVES